ncbi:MAG: BrxA/BrxB family bacilliredoxin [Weeksellaceae bacterium]|nr:BrxA/BrxB family bacilliredoxin [Weeksellaceae bacterium]
MYPPQLVQPMKNELVNNGFSDLTTIEEVDQFIQQSGTVLLVVNSVCGCAAGGARPGVVQSLNNEFTPDHLGTVFAGFDMDATARAREHMLPFPPSSPAVALFKDGEIVHMLERHHIEGHMPLAIADNLKQAYNEFCS